MPFNIYGSTIDFCWRVCKCGWADNYLITLNEYYTALICTAVIEIRLFNVGSFTWTNVNCSSACVVIISNFIIIEVRAWNDIVWPCHINSSTTSVWRGACSYTIIKITFNDCCAPSCNIDGTTTITRITVCDISMLDYSTPSGKIYCSSTISTTIIKGRIVNFCIITKYKYVPTHFCLTIMEIRTINNSICPINTDSPTGTVWTISSVTWSEIWIFYMGIFTCNVNCSAMVALNAAVMEVALWNICVGTCNVDGTAAVFSCEVCEIGF